MIFVLMHWHEKDSSDSSVEPDPLTDSLEADVHTFLVARATSHKWCEGRSCSVQSVQMFLWPWVVHARWAKRCSRQIDCFVREKTWT